MNTMNDREIQQAEQRRDAAKSQLYRPDGRPVFGEQEHRERLRAIEAEFKTRMDAIEGAIEERVERARGELASLENADPAFNLSTDEVQRASALSVFVADEVADLSLADLARRCRTAASSAGGDRAASYALLRHAARRADDDVSGVVRDAVAELRRALDPDREEKVAAAKADLEEVEAQALQAQLARHGAASLGDAYSGAGGYWGAAS